MERLGLFLRGWLWSFLKGIAWTIYFGIMIGAFLALWDITDQPGFDGVFKLFWVVYCYLIVNYCLFVSPLVDGVGAAIEGRSEAQEVSTT